jgi:hypothetical protein
MCDLCGKVIDKNIYNVRLNEIGNQKEITWLNDFAILRLTLILLIGQVQLCHWT